MIFGLDASFRNQRTICSYLTQNRALSLDRLHLVTNVHNPTLDRRILKHIMMDVIFIIQV